MCPNIQATPPGRSQLPLPGIIAVPMLAGQSVDMVLFAEQKEREALSLASQGNIPAALAVYQKTVETVLGYSRSQSLNAAQKKRLQSLCARLLDTAERVKNKSQSVAPVESNNHSSSSLLGRNRNPVSQKKDKLHQVKASSKSERLDTSKVEELDTNIVGAPKGLVQNLISTAFYASREDVAWNDVAGLATPKRILQETVILPFRNRALFTGLRTPCSGILFFGPPGCGKTLLVRALAHESGANLWIVSAATLVSKFMGEGEQLVRTLFALARQNNPSIIFVDEADALLSARKESGEHEAMRRLKTEFLVQLDGLPAQIQAANAGESLHLTVIAATNRPYDIDDAARRRFERRIYLPLPNDVARKEMLERLLMSHSHSITAAQLKSLVAACEGYSFADLRSLAREAAFEPIREMGLNKAIQASPASVRAISIQDFKKAIANVRASVDMNHMKEYERFNDQFGSA